MVGMRTALTISSRRGDALSDTLGGASCLIPHPPPPKSKPPISASGSQHCKRGPWCDCALSKSSANCPPSSSTAAHRSGATSVCARGSRERFVCWRSSQLLWIHQQLALQEQQEQQPKLPTRCASLCASGLRYRTSRPTWHSASVASSPTGLRSSACTQIAGPTGAVRRMPRPSPSTASLRPHRRRTLCTAVPLSRRSRPAERLQAQPGPWP